MGVIVSIHDFKFGDYRFQINNSVSQDLESYYVNKIESLEKLWIKTIIGEVLGDEFISDPLEARWNKIKEPFIWHDRQCYGIKHALIAFIYSDLIKSDGAYSPQSVQKVKSEVFQSVNIQANYSRAYNDGVENANLIRFKLHHHKDEFFANYCPTHLKRLLKSLPF